MSTAAAVADEAEAAPTVVEPAKVEGSESAELELPTACADATSTVCTPAPTFAEQLCKKRSTDVALVMFKKGSPWSRVYLRLDIEAWYTGGRLSAPSQLVLDEEVIVMKNRSGGSAGIQIVGAGSLDVLRWNGTCVSVMADEVTFKKPGFPRVSPIAWKRLSDPTREALLKSTGISLRLEVQRQRCREDNAADRCTEATSALSQLIADFVRKGGEVPEPKLVMW